MKLQTLILFVSSIFSGFMIPLWGASSQGSSTASPTAISTLEPSQIDPLVRVRQMVENNPQNASEIATKAIQADPQHSIFYAGEVVRSAIRGLGNSISEVAISFLVAAAVNACPQAALQIVRVAVGETPPKITCDYCGSSGRGRTGPIRICHNRPSARRIFRNSACA